MKKIAICLLFLVCTWPGVALANHEEWEEMDEKSQTWLIVGYILGQKMQCLNSNNPDALGFPHACQEMIEFDVEKDMQSVLNLINNVYNEEKYFTIPLGPIIQFTITVQAGNLSKEDFYKGLDEIAPDYQ